MARNKGGRSDTDRWGLDIESSRALARARVPQDGLCWWCRARSATTAEHKFKATDLRRMAERDPQGNHDPRSLFRVGATYSGLLRSLARGTTVQWSKSMCGNCNGGRDRHMDAAYEVFSDYVWNHQDDLATATHFDWGQLFRTDWQAEARNVARYYAKQVGCLFAQQNLPVPDGIIRFMDGANQADDFVFFLARDRGRRAAQRVALRRGIDGRAYWLPPSSATLTPDGSRVASFSHQAYIGFICVQIDYAVGLSYPSFWETPGAPIVELSGQPPWRVHLMMARARFRQSVERLKLRRDNK